MESILQVPYRGTILRGFGLKGNPHMLLYGVLNL